MNHSQIESFLWGAQDILRDNFEPHEYGNYILPFVVLKRLDDVLVDSKERVLQKLESLKKQGIKEIDRDLKRASSGKYFYNISKFKNLKQLTKDPNNSKKYLTQYIQGFSDNIKEIFDNFGMNEKIKELAKPERENLLAPMLEHFTNKKANLSPEEVDHIGMGLIYENLIRKTNDQTKKAAGQYFTPRDVIELMVRILFSPHKDMLKDESLLRSLYDPAVGTGGMLYVASNYLKNTLKSKITLHSYGQDNLPFAYAICKSDMIMRGLNPDNIKYGNSLTSKDEFKKEKFHYMLSNPPYGKKWKNFVDDIKKESKKGKDGRYFSGLPRQDDGQFLFLQHMISKMYDDETGSRIAVIFNSAPLTSGEITDTANESSIRRWIIEEEDLLEAIIALPTQLFYNTPISTYIWILSNRKKTNRQKKIQLINGVKKFHNMDTSLGEKRRKLNKTDIEQIVNSYEKFEETEDSKIFDRIEFGLRRVTVNLPLRRIFYITPEGVKKLKQEKNYLNLDKLKTKPHKPNQKDIDEIISKMSTKPFKNHDYFVKELKKKFLNANLNLESALQKSIINCFARKDESADLQYNDGKIVIDPDLRDFENIPLNIKVEKYFEKEVEPYVPDFVIDDTTLKKIGYEIPFTKYFYKYNPLQKIKEIDVKIKEAQIKISKDLSKLME